MRRTIAIHKVKLNVLIHFQMENSSLSLQFQEVTECTAYANMFLNLRSAWIIFFIIAFDVVLFLMAIVGNALILVALQSESHLFPTSRMLFRSLASTDLCVGLITQPCFGIFLFSVATNRMRICEITEGMLHASGAVLCGISLSNLTAISVDRLLALHLGLRYRQVLTVTRVRGVIALSWLVYSSLGLLYYLNIDGFLIALPINTLLCILSLTICYMKIVVTMRRRQARVHEERHLNNVNSGRLQMYQKTVTYSMWLSLAIISFYLPFMVVLVVRSIHGNSLSLVRAQGLAACLVFLNSSLNPFIYCWKIKEVRQTVKTTVGRCWPLSTQN